MNTAVIRTVAVAATLALVSVSCGGSEGVGAARTEQANTSLVADAGAEGAAQTPLTSADDPSVIRASELALMLVDQLGSDDAAMAALLRAGDAGYGATQIEAAIVASSLAADGTIAGVAPSHPPVDFVVGLRARSAQDDPLPLPIDQLRREAAEEAGQEDYWPSGALGTALILQWQLAGYSQQQIVEMLIFGVEVLDDHYEGEIAEGEEDCGGYVIGGVHEIPTFCDPETGELFADPEPVTADPHTEQTQAGDSSGLCDDDFVPPYNLIIEPSGFMLETEILGPLETPYYYPEVAGFIDIGADGAVTLTANTVRFADITIRGAPDNQIYKRDFELTGSIDLASGDGEVSGTATGTNQLWSDDSESPVEGEVNGQVAVVCEDDGIAIFGFVTGSGGVLDFEARP